MFITMVSIVAFACVFSAESRNFLDSIAYRCCCLCVQGWRILSNEATSWYTMYKATWTNWWALRERKRVLLLGCSKRARKLINQLDDEINETELDLLAECRYTRAAIIMSRRARLELKYPKWSEANERVVADWVKRNFDDGTSYGVRTRMAPLVIKLAFVKSNHEMRAAYAHTIFKGAIDVA
jgi:hypothetical protein